jgi:hypothetical protein
MTRLQLNLALIVLIGGLAALLYFTKDDEKKGPPLTALTDATLERIRIEHPGKPAIALARQDGQWRLTEPVQVLADPLEVASIVTLATMEAKRKLAVADVDLKELKLDPPSYRVTLNETVLAIGDSEPIEYRRYIRVGEEIALTDDPPGAALDADYADLVSKDLLPPNADIRRIEVPGLTLTRSADGQSWTESPAQAGTTSDQKQKFVDGWKNARAMWNAAVPAGEADKPGEPVTVVHAGGELKLKIVAREPQLILENPVVGVRYTLSKALESEILRLPDPPKTEAAEHDAPVSLPAIPGAS